MVRPFFYSTGLRAQSSELRAQSFGSDYCVFILTVINSSMCRVSWVVCLAPFSFDILIILIILHLHFKFVLYVS